MTIKFTAEAITKGYSFLAGEVKMFPDEIGELIILEGVAFRVAQKSVNEHVQEALREARERDEGNR